MDVAQKIARIGDKIALCCNNGCKGVLQRNLNKGILPRGLYLEDGDGDKGVIVCGQNPATSKVEERSVYIKNPSYSSLKAFWENGPKYKMDYYLRIREFVRRLGYDGPILWTDIAKCESEKCPPKNTLQICANTYLNSEIGACPSSWLLIANGSKTFDTLRSLPNRQLIEVYHSSRFKYSQAQVRSAIDFLEKNASGSLPLWKKEATSEQSPIVESKTDEMSIFWDMFLKKANLKTRIYSGVSPTKQNYINIHVTKGKLVTVANIRESWVELCIEHKSKEANLSIFKAIHAHRSDIDKKLGLGEKLKWVDNKSGKKRCRIELLPKDIGTEDKAQWDKLQDILIGKMIKLYNALEEYVR